MMEQQNLDISRPVLSVRRFGPAATEAENCKARIDSARDNNHTLPFYKADLKSGPIRNPGSVPFVWEKTPGRPKHEEKSLNQNSELPPMVPRFPPGRRRDANEKVEQVRSLSNLTGDITRAKNVITLNKFNVKTEIIGSSIERRAEEEGFSSEDDDEAYEDARDTLSKSESFFDNCSLSGLSGMDGSDANLRDTISADPQAVDFMMGRFLPAAKAMASETPPRSAKKMYMVREQPKQATVQVKATKRISTPDLNPSLLRHFMQNDLEEDSEEDIDEDDQRNVSSKGCGLLPRFCLMNPVPGLKILPKAKAKSVRRVPANCFSTAHGTIKTTMISLAGDCRPAENHSDRTESASTENESSLCSGNAEKQFTGSSIKSQQVKTFASCPKAIMTFQDFLLDKNGEHESVPDSPMVEKTLYIDSGHGTSSQESKGNTKMVYENYHGHDNINNSADNLSNVSTHRTMANFSMEYEKKDLKDEIIGPLDSVEIHAAVFHHDSQVVTDEIPAQDKFSEKGFIISEDSKELINDDKKNQQYLGTGNKLHTGRLHPQLPLPPPLPTCPSDSWLCRTLPSMSSKNQSSRSYLGSAIQIHSKQNPAKQNNVDPKWETLVKTSKQQRCHHRYSEEMLAPIPEA